MLKKNKFDPATDNALGRDIYGTVNASSVGLETFSVEYDTLE